MSAKGKVIGKVGRDALSLVCGACGQVGVLHYLGFLVKSFTRKC